MRTQKQLMRAFKNADIVEVEHSIRNENGLESDDKLTIVRVDELNGEIVMTTLSDQYGNRFNVNPKYIL